jgi:hypothetical protein
MTKLSLFSYSKTPPSPSPPMLAPLAERSIVLLLFVPNKTDNTLHNLTNQMSETPSQFKPPLVSKILATDNFKFKTSYLK